MALMPLSDEFSIGLWNVSNGDVYESNRRVHGHMQAWGMTAQGIYRAGDTIQYKIYVRDQNNQTLVSPPGAEYDLVIRDPAGKIAGKVENIALSRFGAYAGEFPISENAAVGRYNFDLKVSFGKDDSTAPNDAAKGDENEGEDENENENEGDSGSGKSFTLHPLDVLVSDFTPAPFHVDNSLNGDHFKAGDKVDIAADARLHSGGPYANAAVRTTIMLKSRIFASADKAAEGFSFDSFTGQSDSLQLSQTQGKLDQKGESHDSFTLPQQDIVYGQLQVESAVQDDRGKSIASMAQADYFGVDRLVGLKSSQWVYDAKKPATLQAIVVDDRGAPVAGVPIDMQIEQQVISAAKVKGAGNAYLNDITVDWKKIASCGVTSAGAGQDCSFTPPAAGTYRMTASIKDTKGIVHQTQMDLWVTGTDYVQWNDQSELALPIVPEEKEYHVGDTARYLVRNPYPGAKALITIERYGVIDSFVKTLDGSAPIIEFPVKPDYLPGFYLSVIVQSPRVAQPLGDGQIDLGKPAFRMGYVAVPVRDPYKEMLVNVKIADDVYKPRDTIAVDLEANPRFAPETPQPAEIAVAVLDESVFDLIAAGRDAYDPYKGFYALDALDMKNYSLMTRLVGR
ncbi:MAG TPA: MG2 domain-containing protein, partial [Micavibrio sp.]